MIPADLRRFPQDKPRTDGLVRGGPTKGAKCKFTVEAFANLAITTFIIGLPLIAEQTNQVGGAVGLGIFYAAFYGGVFASWAVVPRVAGKLLVIAKSNATGPAHGLGRRLPHSLAD